jgi:hypothetical protein
LREWRKQHKLRLWRNQHKNEVLNENLNGFEQWWSRRPPAIRRLGEQLLARLQPLRFGGVGDQTVPGPTVVEVLARANPKFPDALKRILETADIGAEAKETIGANPGLAIDFYEQESNRRPGIGAPSPIAAEVNTLSLRPLMNAAPR